LAWVLTGGEQHGRGRKIILGETEKRSGISREKKIPKNKLISGFRKNGLR